MIKKGIMNSFRAENNFEIKKLYFNSIIPNVLSEEYSNDFIQDYLYVYLQRINIKARINPS